MAVICPNCDDEFSRIGHHWSMSSCDEPELSDEQHDILTGLLMGDGSVDSSIGRKPYIQTMMKNEEFLEWLDKKLGIFSTGIREVEGTGFAEGSLYHQLRTRRMDRFERYNEWYSSGEKVFPEFESLSPMTLKVWYCCDGDKSTDDRWNKKEYARISCHNEQQRKEKVNSYFDELSFEPTWNDGGRFTFGRLGSHDFWEYIGDPLPGFEYKWPDGSRPEEL